MTPERGAATNGEPDRFLPMLDRMIEVVSRAGWLSLGAAGFGLLTAIAWIDFITGVRASFSVFYLLPVTVVALKGGVRGGLGMAVVGSLVWFSTDLLSRTELHHWSMHLWNAAVHFVYFFLHATLMAGLVALRRRERERAGLDSMTGIPTWRGFRELAEPWFGRKRANDLPITLAYLDVDNFKSVNDTMGHAQGDALLKALSVTARSLLRGTEVFARVGGDEFLLLMGGGRRTRRRAARWPDFSPACGRRCGPAAGP